MRTLFGFSVLFSIICSFISYLQISGINKRISNIKIDSFLWQDFDKVKGALEFDPAISNKLDVLLGIDYLFSSFFFLAVFCLAYLAYEQILIKNNFNYYSYQITILKVIAGLQVIGFLTDFIENSYFINLINHGSTSSAYLSLFSIIKFSSAFIGVFLGIGIFIYARFFLNDPEKETKKYVKDYIKGMKSSQLKNV